MTPDAKYTIDNTSLSTWFERDRAQVTLTTNDDERTIVEWWDEGVWEAIEDGFLPANAFILGRLHNENLMHSAAVEYANGIGA